MHINEFIEKVEAKGYAVENDEHLDRVIITEDNYYHVAIERKIALKAPFDQTIDYVKKEIETLKASK